MPYWLETDAFHELSVWEVLADGNADRVDQLQAAYCRLKSLASHLLSNGYLTRGAALRQCRGRRQLLDRLCTAVLDDPPLLHRPGDDCACLGDQPWTAGYDYRIHAFLRRNPSKREYNRNRAQRADLRDARLKDLVYRRDGGCCRYCTSGPLSAKAGRSKDRRKVLTYDHVDPDQPAGPDGGGLVVACARCNESKGARTPDEADMKLLTTPDPAVAAALLQRTQQLHDQAPDTGWGTPTDQRPITDEPATNQPNTDQEHFTDQQHGADPITDPISDRSADPIADPTPPVCPSPTTSPTDQRTDQPTAGSGLGRVGQPDLIHPQPPPLGQPARTPQHPDVYTRRSRAAPETSTADPPGPAYRWPPGAVPADPPKEQR